MLIEAEATNFPTACSRRGPRFCARLIISCMGGIAPDYTNQSDLRSLSKPAQHTQHEMLSRAPECQFCLGNDMHCTGCQSLEDAAAQFSRG